ncbi:hypothetical protein ACFXKG_30995 [Streptomyces sp. NPDC059255]
MTDKPETERVDCTDCFALPGPDNTRVAYVPLRLVSELGHRGRMHLFC